MPGEIVSIKGQIPHINRDVDIQLKGRNLILIGNNGSGKTTLLDALFLKLNRLLIQSGYQHEIDTRNGLDSHHNALKNNQISEGMKVRSE